MLRIAYLNCGDATSLIPYYRDLLDALREQSDIVDIDFTGSKMPALTCAFNQAKSADIIILSKSFAERLFPSRWVHYALRAVLRSHPRIVGFLANEHRDVPRKLKFLRTVGCKYVVSQYPHNRVRDLYLKDINAEVLAFEGCMSPLPEGMNLRPPFEREFDFGFHGVKYPYYLGHQDRTLIYRHLKRLKEANKWKIDLGDEEGKNFLPGVEFLQRLANTRAVLGSEAGGDFLDYDNSIRFKVIDFENTRKAQGMDTSFEDILQKFGAQFEQARTLQPSGRLVPSRVFEAAATRTLQVLFEGEYGSMFSPWEHYIPLRRDFKNWNEVEKAVINEATVSSITTRMYAKCEAEFTYKRRVVELFEAIK